MIQAAIVVVLLFIAVIAVAWFVVVRGSRDGLITSTHAQKGAKVNHKLPDGASVKFRHERLKEQKLPTKMDDHPRLSPRGGKTTALVTLSDGTVITGEALCSNKDNYSKRIGRDISLGRALKTLEGSHQ